MVDVRKSRGYVLLGVFQGSMSILPAGVSQAKVDLAPLDRPNSLAARASGRRVARAVRSVAKGVDGRKLPLTKVDEVELLARELWEAHATFRQAVIDFPQLHWDEADATERDHWRALARVALAFVRSSG